MTGPQQKVSHSLTSFSTTPPTYTSEHNTRLNASMTAPEHSAQRCSSCASQLATATLHLIPVPERQHSAVYLGDYSSSTVSSTTQYTCKATTCQSSVCHEAVLAVQLCTRLHCSVLLLAALHGLHTAATPHQLSKSAYTSAVTITPWRYETGGTTGTHLNSGSVASADAAVQCQRDPFASLKSVRTEPVQQYTTALTRS
jgi:hypothetical protein